MPRSGPKIAPPSRQLIDALLNPLAFDHPVASIELIETHISWVILTDTYAYKIKKPVALGFLDFSDLARRKFYCEEEIRLNQPWAPAIYIGVVPITNGDRPRFNGNGEPLEYAVKMRRFDQELRLDAQLASGKLTRADMKELGQVIAARHAAAPRVAATQRDHQLRITRDFIRDNFAWLAADSDSERLAFLVAWTERELAKVDTLLGQRFDAGFVRDCHGDLHLANLVRLSGGIATFDCIEFNADLRQSDVICDIAFLVMDLVAHERHDLASCFLNRYLECNGDYAGMALLDLYFVYRCLVRAKVAAISVQEVQDQAEREAELAVVGRYCDMARRQASRKKPVLIVMCGLSGSGKTWLSDKLMAALPAIRVRSDIERKRLFGLSERADSHSGSGSGIYDHAADAMVYGHLNRHAALLLESGHNVILDATFLTQAERHAALHEADVLGCRGVILHVDAPQELLRKRILERSRKKDDPSEAGLAVLDHQLEHYEPISKNEQSRTLSYANIGDIDIAAVVSAIRDN